MTQVYSLWRFSHIRVKSFSLNILYVDMVTYERTSYSYLVTPIIRCFKRSRHLSKQLLNLSSLINVLDWKRKYINNNSCYKNSSRLISRRNEKICVYLFRSLKKRALLKKNSTFLILYNYAWFFKLNSNF